jgi:hypothetical protein
VVRRDSPEAATAALATFRESLARQGQLPAGTEAPPDRLNADTAYYGRLAVRTRGPFVCGVTHFSAQDVVAADALLRSIVSRLENR